MSILIIRSIKLITIKMLIMRLSTFKINFFLGIITTTFPSAKVPRFVGRHPALPAFIKAITDRVDKVNKN